MPRADGATSLTVALHICMHYAHARRRASSAASILEGCTWLTHASRSRGQACIICCIDTRSVKADVRLLRLVQQLRDELGHQWTQVGGKTYLLVMDGFEAATPSAAFASRGLESLRLEGAEGATRLRECLWWWHVRCERALMPRRSAALNRRSAARNNGRVVRAGTAEDRAHIQ